MPGARTDYAAVSEYLFGLKPRGTKFGIGRMRLLAAALGRPERGLPVIHVAGTNGKGSVAAMLEAILRAAGWRVGLYTSPHLVHLGERVQVDRVPLFEDEIVGFVRELDPVADRIAAEAGPDDRPSFFEFMTAMAFLQFRRKRCDIAVIEVGLGGELDATNIVDPSVSVITSIGMDHCEYLGESLESIAQAKAGIIKPGRPVVLGRVPAVAEKVIRDVAAARGAALTSVRELFGEALAEYPSTALAGDYQRWNAATATLAAGVLGDCWQLTTETVTRGLREVRWAGRWQEVRVGGRRVILDASHNPEGAEVLEENLSRLASEVGRGPIVVVGVLGAERARPLLAAIARHAKAVHLVVPNQPRATGHAELRTLISDTFRGDMVDDTVARIFPNANTCAIGGAEDIVVVTGSIYLLGEVMTRLAR